MILRLSLLAAVCLALFACQSQTWEETKVHYERHDKHHGDHGDHSEHDEHGDHAKEG